MHIQLVEERPVHQIPYHRAGMQGATEVAELPFLTGVVDGLPLALDALVCTSDLQGNGLTREPEHDAKLLGEIVADELTVLLEVLGLAPGRTGIVLAGDFFSAPQADERGASGDVRPVWNTFGSRYAWVAGVLGNHDKFGSGYDGNDSFAASINVYPLDGTTCCVDGLTIAGISGIIGNPMKPLRRSASQYLAILARLSRKKPDLMILHPSPSLTEHGLWGAEELEAAYKQHSYPLTVSGHVSWPTPLVELDNGNQLLNVDSRVVVLKSVER